MKLSNTILALSLGAGFGTLLEERCAEIPGTPALHSTRTETASAALLATASITPGNSVEQGPKTEETFTAWAPVLKEALEQDGQQWDVSTSRGSSHLVYEEPGNPNNRTTLVSLPNPEDISSTLPFSIVVETYAEVSEDSAEPEMKRVNKKLIYGKNREEMIRRIREVMATSLADTDQ